VPLLGGQVHRRDVIVHLCVRTATYAHST
jgi:hypothetical protein